MPIPGTMTVAKIIAALQNAHTLDTQEILQYLGMCIPPWLFSKLMGETALGLKIVEIRGYRGAISNVPAMLDLSADQATFLAYPNPLNAYVLQSTSANDDAAPATGAQIVRIDYLDANHAAAHVDITLDGVAQVPALGIGEATAINGMKVIQAGATRTNEGAITLTDAGLLEELCRIPIATGRSHACRYHVPVGYNLILSRFLMECGASVGDGQAFDLIGTIQDPDTLAPSLPGCLRDLGPWGLLEGQKWEHIFDDMVVIPASTAAILSEIACWVTGDVAATDDAAASIFGVLVAV